MMDDRQQQIPTVPSEPEPPPGVETVTGFLDHITFQNPETGYLVGRLMPEGGRLPITIVGVVANVREGQSLRVWGRWETHRDYGPQFRVESALEVAPSTREGIERFLIASVDGIGKRTAHRIVQAFGLDTFRVLDEDPDQLRTVPKVTRKVIANLKETWEAHKAVREIMVFLHGLGISQGFADRIYRTYGRESVAVLRENPYRLAMDLRGVGFKIADAIARKLEVPHEAPQRAEAGLIHVLEELVGEGHTGYPEGRLLHRAQALLEVPGEVIASALADLVEAGYVRRYEPEAGLRGEAGEPFYLRPRFERAESRIVEYLERIARAKAATADPALVERLGELERETGIYLDATQRAAVEATLAHKVLLLTGGPGTGKTTIIRFILGLLGEADTRLSLAAPTGKAAKRMAEATGHPASTIHRLLEAGGEGFGRCEERPLETDLIVLDECSMIDTLLMEALLEAVPPEARLVLVGDVDQLPSVGPGMVLQDLIDSQRFPVVRLERIHRQSGRSRITLNAHRIRRGEPPDLSRPEDEELIDFYFMPEADPERIVGRILELVTRRIPERFGLNPKADVQVLSPMHRGPTGGQNLNRQLQEALNPRGEEVNHGDRRFRVGDRVLQTRNDYDKAVFNGDMGEIAAWDAETDTLTVVFDERPVRYERKELDQLALGYAITVHKAQGSEYPAVVLPFTTHHAIMLQRNLLYTAITRGRRLVVVLGTEKAIGMAVRNARRDPRYTRLRQRLVAALPPQDADIGAPPPEAEPHVAS